ncbi:MAG: molybdopterin-dependent oxidoreductase [Actinomycetota bacterium]
MKRLLTLFSVLLLALVSACGSDSGSDSSDAGTTALVVSGGDVSESYGPADLEALGTTDSEFNGAAYVGVPVADLVADAGFDPAAVKSVKAVASDGFTVNYDPGQVFTDGVIVAYALPDGDMSAADGTFRMVLPDQEGKLNVRMLVELQVTQ